MEGAKPAAQPTAAARAIFGDDDEPGGLASMTGAEYWNARARGMGGRYTTAAEENILGLLTYLRFNKKTPLRAF